MAYAPAQITALEALVPGLAPHRSLPSRLIAALKAAHARRKAIHDYENLLAVDPHLLADIGVSRADVRAALHAARQG
jgi:uncharacterized protein YjiS (DUF1127 family)